MKLKKEYLILIVLIVALALYLMMRSAGRDADIPQPARLEASKLSRLVVTVKQSAPVELVKKDERWQIEPKKYAVDQTVIGNMTRAAAELTLSAIVSESGSYERYGLTPKEGITVQAFSEGKQVRAFSIGKTAPTNQHTFVLVEGDPKVYHARGQIETVFNQTVDSLRDKTVFAVEKQNITDITIVKGSYHLTLVKKKIQNKKAADDKTATPQAADTTPEAPQFEWEKPGGTTAEHRDVDLLLDNIVRLNCDGFLEDEDPAKLSKAVLQITFRDGTGEYRLAVFPEQKETKDKRPAVASSTPYPFYLSRWRVEGLEKSIDGLLAANR
ncbi:MAG: DUF4340 domain-containing protein [Deltaproteobacteria bacterium]|nr:DUF4340 domain-containing protein [Deltaproteobacteria bacterium]